MSDITETENQEHLSKVIEESPTAEIKPNPIDENNFEGLVYFCKDCRKLVEKPVQLSNKKNFSFKCPECGSKDVAYGTKRSIYGFFNLDEEGVAPEMKKKSKGSKVGEIAEKKASK